MISIQTTDKDRTDALVEVANTLELDSDFPKFLAKLITTLVKVSDIELLGRGEIKNFRLDHTSCSVKTTGRCCCNGIQQNTLYTRYFDDGEYIDVSLDQTNLLCFQFKAPNDLIPWSYTDYEHTKLECLKDVDCFYLTHVGGEILELTLQ